MVNVTIFLILALGSVCINAETCQEAYDRIKPEVDKGLIGPQLPSCLPDGTYAPFQWTYGWGKCVTAEGKILIPPSRVSVNMNCLCVRAKFEAKDVVGIEFNCDPVTGNYRPRQCRGSICYCSDPEGHLFGDPVPRGKKLEDCEN